MVFRRASHAGSWYSGSKKELQKDLNEYFMKVPLYRRKGSVGNPPTIFNASHTIYIHLNFDLDIEVSVTCIKNCSNLL